MKIEHWYPVLKNRELQFLRYPDQMPGFTNNSPEGWTTEDKRQFWNTHELAGKVSLVDIIGFKEKFNLESSKIDIQPFETNNGEASFMLEVRKV